VKVGDFAGNGARLRAVIGAACERGVHLLVTPELGISGYSLEDRVWWPDIAQRSWEALEDLATCCQDIAVFAGLPVRIDSMVYNGTALAFGGRVRGLILKKHLPTYSIFYEGRNWASWTSGMTDVNGVPAGDLVFRLPFGMVSAEICEDLWSADSPALARAHAGAEVICNSSASPFTPLKNAQRRRLVQGAAEHLACVYAYANLLGCDSSRLVFDGGGFIATPDRVVAEGPILAKSPWTLTTGDVDLDDIARFRAENSTWREGHLVRQDQPAPAVVDASEGVYVPPPLKDYVAQMPEGFFDGVIPNVIHTTRGRGAWCGTHRVETGKPSATPVTPGGVARNAFYDELFDALVLGLRDYFEKVGIFERFLVALSGGRDSSLCLLLAVHAAKSLREGRDAARYAERVNTVYLPNKAFSSPATEAAARALAEELGVPFKVVSITEEVEVAMAKAAELMGGADKVTPLARQNLQARVRGNMMLNWANSANALLLVTSNLSEAAVGYTTTGGDNQGGYSPIANVPKSLLSRLVEYLAQRDGIKAIERVLAIPPSAELAPDQFDEADLMPYVVLDDLLYLFAKRRLSLADCWRVLCYRHPDHEPEQLRTWTADFGKRFVHSQWKRDQHPVTMKVMDLDLDPKTGFRFPVTQSIHHELEALAAARLEDGAD
jgi:NAD+ synthase (glutamine-hydrolysing)